MQINIFETAEELARFTAGKIIDVVMRKPGALLCLAGGETPRLTYQYIVKEANNKQLDFSTVQWVSLDEWVGVPKTNAGSCFYFLQEALFAPLNVDADNIHFFDSMAADLAAECERIDAVIQQNGGIDLILVGLGMNGHIGFNEPGIADNLNAHVISLDAITQRVGQKYFTKSINLQKGITLGLGQFMQSRIAILLASGAKKAGIVQKAVQNTVSTTVPASYIQAHQNGWVLLDRAAAALLT